MNQVRRNMFANFAGTAWQTLMGIAFIPLYVKFMGVASYGLVGIFAALQAMSFVLDLGLSATVTRETARLSALPGREQEMRDLVRSLEAVYWCVAILIGLTVALLAPLIANHWVKGGQVPSRTIEQAVCIMGCVLALQWPSSFYSGGLVGLQQQVLMNVITVCMGTLRWGGAALVLLVVSPTIQAFFIWQILVSGMTTGCMALSLWKNLPTGPDRPAIKIYLLAGIWRFAAGISGISILTTILMQLDKIILSKMLTLEMFGYYSLAGVVAMVLCRCTGPVFSAVYPRFTQLVSIGDRDGLRDLYHRSCQFVSVLILPVAAVVAMFSYEIMLIWTQNPEAAVKTHQLVSILICGTALNGLMNMPYGLQLAHGWTRLSLFANVIAVIVLTPLIVLMTRAYGAIGGASVWVILNGSYILFTVHIMHKRLLPNEKWTWYVQDIGIPLLVSILIVSLGRFCVGDHVSPIRAVVYLPVILIITLGLTAMATATTRGWLFSRIAAVKSYKELTVG